MDSDRQLNLQRFHGGLSLRPHKSVQTAQPIGQMSPPQQVWIPLRQHRGMPAQVCVETGQLVAKGQVIGQANGALSANVHASISGKVGRIEARPLAHPSGLSDTCIEIVAEHTDDYETGLRITHDYHLEDPNILRLKVADAGIVGLGGAVFPTAIKLTAEADQSLHTLVLNGAECEPYICCDEMLMREHAQGVLTGAQMLLHILQIGKCIIAIEHDRTAAIIAVKKALDDLADERFQLALVHAIYPEGGERQLIEVLSGQQVPSDGLPVDIGYLCQNVATAYAVYDAFNNGQALTSRVVSVGGKGIRKPQNLLVPTGTSIKDVVNYCGGFEEGDYRLIVGGPMMGFTIPTTEVPVDKATNSILALPIDETRASHPVMPCIRCGDCATVCPASLLPQELYWHARGDTNIDGLKRLHVFDCIECGCCDYVCPSNLPLTQYFRFAKDELWYREARKKLSEHARDRFEDREQRLLQAKLERDERRILRKKQLADQTSRQQEIQAAVKRAAAREKNTSEKGQ